VKTARSKSVGVERALQNVTATTDGGIRRGIVVVYRSVSELKLDPHNPRVHSPRQIRQIARSIEAFGFNVPVLVDSALKLIAGHGRVLAAQQLGLAELPTISLDHLN
jgi:ParB-like chromosome segregation protein Spo0J